MSIRKTTDHPDYVAAKITGLEVEVKVGIHPWERHPEHPSRLIVDVEMYCYSPKWNPQALHDVMDYDRVRTEIMKWPGRKHTDLLETLALELVNLCFEDARVDAARVSITKPDIFSNAKGAGIELFRHRPI